MTVVGIGYQVGAINESIALRARDLTPSSDPFFSKIGPKMPSRGGASFSHFAF
jgi:hypothetical protein